MVCRAGGANETCPVKGKYHMEVLDCHIMNDLLESALEERGINCNNRFASLSGKSGSERHTMLLSNSDIEELRWNFPLQLIKACSIAHCCGDAHFHAGRPAKLYNSLPKHRGITWWSCWLLVRYPRRFVGWRHAV